MAEAAIRRPSGRVDARPTFRTAFGEFLRDGQARSLSPQTLDWYTMIGERFARFHDEYAGTDRLDAITLPEARAFVLRLRDDGLAPTSVLGYVRGIKAIFNWFANDGLLEPNPIERLVRPKVPRRIIPTLSEDHIERLMAEASSRDRLLITVLLDTGLRLGELVGLRLDDLAAAGYLRVRGKGDKERIVPIGSVAERYLHDYIARERRPIAAHIDAVFLAHDGRALSPAAVKQVLRKIGVRAGLDGVRTNPHTFRHTFAKLYLLNGGDLFSLQRILGHTTLDMVRRYVDLNTSEVKQVHLHASPVDRLAASRRRFARR